ncbi:hypothetical protein SAMN02745116_00650 [Pilibacter termitis]|uniref:Uncharacterized protein n=1 Tax=Pilibacter termitis TaxID=263852 RepID=A0A1T4LED3_9ENTE|nr:hypothetical protein SAMN02745116_00650 [Pilibacter termitis]
MKKISIISTILLVILICTSFLIRQSLSFVTISDDAFLAFLFFAMLASLQLLLRTDTMRFFRDAWSKLRRKETTELAQNHSISALFSIAFIMLVFSLVTLCFSRLFP